jgi:hypothetical protein
LRIDQRFPVRPATNWDWPTAILTIYFVLRFSWIAFVAKDASATLFDEALCVFILLPAAICALTQRGYIIGAFYSFVVYAFAGFISLALNDPGGVSQPLGAFVDIALDAKVVVMLLAFYQLIASAKNGENGLRTLSKVIIALALVNSVFVIRDLLFGGGFGITGNRLLPRLGLYQPQGLLKHHLESCWLTFFAALSAMYMLKERLSLRYALLSLYLVVVFFLHISAKEMFAFLICALLFIIGRPGRAPVWILFMPLLLIVLLLSVSLTAVGDVFMSQYQHYAGEETQVQVRTILYRVSSDLALTHLPFGTGAGTFASPPSFQMGYSNLYYEYGISMMWGATPDNPNFLVDVYWPKILGQSGFLGLIAFMSMLVCVTIPLVNNFIKTRTPISWLSLSVHISILVISVGATPFTHEFTLPMWAFIAAHGIYAARSGRITRGASQGIQVEEETA